MSEEIKLRNYHAQVWDEPLLMEKSVTGQRGILVPEAEGEVKAAVGEADGLIPSSMRRATASGPARDGPAAGSEALHAAVADDHG